MAQGLGRDLDHEPTGTNHPYSVAASFIESTEVEHELDTWMTYYQGVLTVHQGLADHGLYAATLLYHEGVHGALWPSGRHVPCPDGERLCDEDDSGSNGAQAEYAGEVADALPREDEYFLLWLDDANDARQEAEGRILASER